MTVIDDPRFNPLSRSRSSGTVMNLAVGGPTSAGQASGGCGDCESCACSDADDTAADRPVPDGGVVGDERIAGFDTAIAMAEAASCGNVTWWNEIRAHADDPAEGEYAASVLLATLIKSSAHRFGVPTADVWSVLRRLGHLPL